MTKFALSLGAGINVIEFNTANAQEALRLVTYPDDDPDSATPVADGLVLQTGGGAGDLAPVTLGGAGGVTGTGTSGKISKWTGVSSQGNSILSESGTVISLAGSLDVAQGFSLATIAKTGTYTATVANSLILCDASGGAFTVTLPAAASHPGRIYNIKKTDSSSNAVTVDGNSSETIDEATTAVLSAQYESLTVQSDGTEWWIL